MRHHLKCIWHLALPLSLGLVIQMAIVMIDSAFAGNINHFALAAVSLTGAVFYVFLLVLLGVTVASSIKAGQAVGAENYDDMLNCFRQGTLLCLVIGVFLSILFLNISPVMLLLGQDPQVVELAEHYLFWLAWTLPLQAIAILFRDYFAVIDKPWSSVTPIFLTLLLNTFLDYCLANGNLGFPAMGISGIGLASLFSNIFLVTMLFGKVGWRTILDIFNFKNPKIWRNKSLLKLLLISFPIGLTLLVEESFFSGTVFLAGILGADEQAAHQILLNTVGTSFLFNTGIGIACAILIGKYVGSGQHEKIMPTVKAGWLIAQLFTIPFAIILLLFHDQWIALFIDVSLIENEAVVVHANSILIFAIVMLFIDAVWLVIIESLHGILDTLYPAISALVAYWLIGAPLGYWATQIFPNALDWVWIAMLIAVSLLTVLVYFRLRFMLRKLETPGSDYVVTED